ncbi:helix-turn-helix domain-containing protein [Clostridium butyricum]|uniref:helix-turn-helix domain-containing protein n=1 Tax=Clostridium butyricum TaxID=1492 RepID=UPI0034678E54
MIGDNIRRIRKEKGYSINKLSKETGISLGYLSDLENNKAKNPSMDKLKTIAKFLETTLNDIIGSSSTISDNNVNQENQNKINIKNSISNKILPDNFISIPIVGSIRAGKPIFAEDNYLGTIPVMSNTLKSDSIYFGLIVKGDSMNLEFTEGSTLVVEKTPCLENGQIGVIRIDGMEATVKKVVISGSMITLIPMSSNKEHIPHMYNLETDDIEIIGRVIQAIKTY